MTRERGYYIGLFPRVSNTLRPGTHKSPIIIYSYRYSSPIASVAHLLAQVEPNFLSLLPDSDRLPPSHGRYLSTRRHLLAVSKAAT